MMKMTTAASFEPSHDRVETGRFAHAIDSSTDSSSTMTMDRHIGDAAVERGVE